MKTGCYHCEKKVIFGRSHTHHRGVAGGRWKKRAPKTQKLFFPNLQRMTIIEEGKIKRIRLCTKCLKRIKKDIKDCKRPFLRLVNQEPKKTVKTEVKTTPPG